MKKQMNYQIFLLFMYLYWWQKEETKIKPFKINKSRYSLILWLNVSLDRLTERVRCTLLKERDEKTWEIKEGR